MTLRLYAWRQSLAFAALLLFFWFPFRTDLQAAAVLDRVSGKPLPRLLRDATGYAVDRQNLIIASPNGPVRARLYSPVHDASAPGVVVLHGVQYLGIDDPRMVTFASAMASCGLRVLTPELAQLADYRVNASSIATVGSATNWMAAHNGGHAVGVMGLSFSGGLALLAAAEPQYRASIAFVVTVGAQDDMVRVANYFVTGKDSRPDGSVESLKPNDYGALVLEYEHPEDFVPAADIPAARAVLRAHLDENSRAEKQAVAALNSRQLAEVKQLMNTSSPAMRTMILRSNTKHLAAMAAVSPQGHLADLATPVYLLAGTADDIIPSSETQWLDAQLPHRDVRAELISPVLSHVNINGHGPTLMDRLRLVHFFAEVLQAAESRVGRKQ